MLSSLIEDLLNGDSKELRDIANNEALLVGFLTLAKGIDDLPDVSIRFYEDSRSLYQVTSSGRDLDELAVIMAEFFGQPAKAAGKSLPVGLRFDPAVKYLGGIRKNQVFFQKKIKTGSYYGALWPWERDPDKIEIHLGFCSPGMGNAEYNQLGALVKKFISKKKIEAISNVGGQIHGISLPSFLQMSEMEGATYTLKVTSGDRVGCLYLDGGNLIAAQYGDRSGSEAAHRIISWDNASIQIETADTDREKEIHEPLMHVMMESLKIKDESGAESASPPSDSPPPPPPPKNVPAPSEQPLTIETAPPSASTTQPGEERAVEPEDTALQDSETPVIQPFQKAVDNAAGKQNQMSRLSKLLIVLGGVIVLAAGAVGGGIFLKNRQAGQRYEQLTTDLAAENALDARIVLLMKYISDYPEDDHRAELEKRLNQANQEIEERDYQKTLADVKGLPIDDRYEKKALSLYTVFLSRYPQSTYADKINLAIDGIRQNMAMARFENLKKIPQDDHAARYTAYRDYLNQFPKGTHKEAVNQMVADLGDEYFLILEKQASVCDAQKIWDDCLAKCDRFLADFAELPSAEKVRALRGRLQDKKDFVDLTVKAELAGDNYVRAKQIYADYLASRPETTQKTLILKRIEVLNGELAQKAAWEKTAAYAANPANEVTRRIQHVEKYIQKNQSGPYAGKARNLLKQLEPERKAAIRAQKEKARQRQTQARQQAAKDRQKQETLRIKNLRQQVARQFRDVASRYTDNGDGTVTDRVTGYSWCLLDSYLELGRCISYRTAKTYVRQLEVGGHKDWRLPTAGELAGIYKSRPYFPGSGAEWYWTSDSFVRGYHRVVDVVTSAPQTVFTRDSKNEDRCGNVRAIR